MGYHSTANPLLNVSYRYPNTMVSKKKISYAFIVGVLFCTLFIFVQNDPSVFASQNYILWLSYSIRNGNCLNLYLNVVKSVWKHYELPDYHTHSFKNRLSTLSQNCPLRPTFEAISRSRNLTIIMLSEVQNFFTSPYTHCKVYINIHGNYEKHMVSK